MIEALIAIGHDEARVWTYTPRRMNGYLTFAGIRKKIEAAQEVAFIAIGSQGSKKSIESTIKDLST